MASKKAWWWKASSGLQGRGRTPGRGRRAGSVRRWQLRRPLIEELEPRLVLTGFLSYTSPSTGSNLTLRVANVGGASDLQLFNNVSSSVIQQVALTQDIQVKITGANKASDLLTVNLSYAGGGTSEPIAVQFAGGLPASGVTDKVTIGGAGTQYQPSTFTLQSDSPVFVTGILQAKGDISLTDGQKSTGAVTAPGVITANAAAGITVNGSLTGHNITLASQSTITVNSQSASLFNGLVKLGLVSSTSGASVQVQGGKLTAAGNLSLMATLNVTVALATAPSAPGATNTDAAVSTSNVASTATVAVSAGTLAATSGTATIAATNTVNVTTTADGTAGGSAASAKGGTAAVTVLSGDTDATVSGGTVSASGVNVSATDNRTVTTLARATQGGATPGSPNPTKGQQMLTNYGAKTPDGSVNVAGAVAVTSLTGDANARVIGGTLTSTSAPLAVTATAANHPTTTANASASKGASGTGVGVAVAIGHANANSLASLGGTASVTAPAVNVTSLMPATVNAVTPASQFSVAATSGPSGAAVGVAGSLAIDVTSAGANAIVEPSSSVNVHGANLTLGAQSTTSSPASATPKQVSGQSIGVGASVAIDVPAVGALAAVESSATLTGAHNLTLSATGNHTATTDALAGAAGGTAVSGALSLAIPSGATQAAIVSGPAMTITGGLTVTTDRTSTITTRVDSASAASGVAVGALTALTIANESAASSVGRNVTTGASAALIHAEGHGAGGTTALASVSGAKPGTTVVNTLLGNVASFAKGQGWTPGTVTLPLAATPDGKAGVAGAIAVNLASVAVSAQLLAGATLNVAGGGLTIEALVTYNDSATAGGTAVNTATGVAGAVAINDSNPTAAATIAGSATATALTVTATANGQTGVTANSGQGSTSVGVAGALALDLPGASSQAAVAAGGSAVVKGSTTGDVVVQAKTTVIQDVATANAKASGFAKTGVGASVALDIPTNAATAEALGTVTSPDQVTMFASGSYNSTATAAAGATGGTATAPALALDVPDDSTLATVGAAALIAAGGQLLVRALHRDKTTGQVTGATAGSGVAVGAALGLDVGLDSDKATIAGKVTQSGTLTVEADMGYTNTALGTSSAKGAASGSTAVDTLIGNVVSFGKSSDWLPSTTPVPKASTPTGEMAVAAAAAVDVDLATETATVATGGSVVTSSPMLVHTLSNLDDSAIANGSPSDGSALGVGAALAIDVALPAVQASIAGAVKAPAINVETQMSGGATNTFQATASSGAGTTTTGVAGALAINVGASQSTAAIQNGATLTIGGGALLVNAVDVTADLSSALAKSANPEVGLGASIAANAALNLSHAFIGSAAITGEHDITVEAAGTHQVTTLSNAGAQVPTAAAAAAISAAFAGDQTVAEILAGPATLVVPGTLDVHATDQATINTTADGKTTGAGVGVGAAVAVGVDREVTTAQLARSANVQTIVLHADSTTPTTTTATAGAKGGKSFVQSLGVFVNTVLGLVDPDLGSLIDQMIGLVDPTALYPIPVDLPLVGSTLAAIQNQTGLALPPLSAAAAIGVSGVLPQTLAQLGANAALTSATPVTIQTNVTANPVTTADGSATGNTVAAHLSLAANYAGGNNQVVVGKGASITAPSITLTAGGPGTQALTAKADAGAGSVADATAAVAINAGDPNAPNTVQVTVGSGSHLTASKGNVSLAATSDVTSTTLAGGGALGLAAGAGASIAGTFLQEQANVAVAGQVNAPAGNVSLTATGHDTLLGAAVAGSVALATVDAAIRADVLGKTVEAHVDPGGNVRASGDVTINAVSDDDPEAVETGLGLAVATVSAAATAVALEEHTWAFINGATVKANGNVLLSAGSSTAYDPIAATGTLGLLAGVGVSGTLFYESEDTQAYITGGANVDALALGATDNVLTGTETNGVPNTRPIRGVSLTATNVADFQPLAGSIGGGLIAAAQGSGIATVLNNHVVAYIGAAKVNQNDAGSAASQLVNLLAWDDTHTAGVQGSLGAALVAGVSATFDFAMLVKDTEAYIGTGAVVSSNSSVEVRADSTEDLNSFAGTLNLAGLASVAAAGTIHVVQAQTMAHTDSGAQVTAPGSVLVLANSSSDDNVISVVGSLGIVSGQGMYSEADLGGATTSALKIGTLTIGGKPGLTSAAVNSQVTANTLNVSSTSSSTPTAESVLVGAGAITVSAASPTAQTSLQTSASIGSNAVVKVTTLVGPVASSVNTANAFDLHVNAGAITGTALLPDAVAGGATRAFVAEGAKVTASGLNVQAVATNTATVTPISITAGAITGSYAAPQASTAQDVEAYIGPAFGTDPNSGLSGAINVGKGTITVNAQSLKNQATVNEISITAGAVTLSYMHPQATINGSTRAHVGGTFNITAGAVNVTGASGNTATTNVISIDAGAATAVANTQGATTNHTTEAYVGDKANLTLNDPLALHATSTNTATAGEANIQAGFANVAYAKSEANAGGATRAYVQEGASIKATGLSVLADAANTATANSFATSLGNINVAIAQPTAQTTHTVEAYIGPPSGQAANAGLSGSINVGTTTIAVHATSTSNHATAQQIGIKVGPVAVSVEQPRVTVGGSTLAHVGGKFTITSGTVDVLASSPNNVATGNAVSIVAATANVGVNDRAAMTDHTTQAYAGTNAGLTLTGGTLSLHATSTNTAESGQVAIGISGVGVQVAKSEANAGGDTAAYVQEGASITAKGLDLSAQSTNTAEANPVDFGVAAVKVAVAHPIAETTATTEVYVGPPAGASPTSGASGKISVGSGSVTGEASSTNSATVDPLDIGASGIDVSVLHPEVTAGGSTAAHLGGTFSIGAGTLQFTATSKNTATSNSVSVELSGVNVTDSEKSALTNQATSAYVGKQAKLTISGASLGLDAESTNTATAGEVSFSLSGVKVGLIQPAADVEGSTLAYVDQGAALDAPGLTATATATGTATASVDLAVLSAVPISLIQPSAKTGDDVEAYIGPAANVAPTANLNGSISLGGAAILDATTHDTAQVNSTDITAGAVNVSSVRPKVTAGGTTLAHLGGNFTINAPSVSLTASAPDTKATTQTFSLDIGAVNAGVTSVPVTAAHETDAFLAPGASVTVAGGPLTFHATSGSSATANSQSVDIGAAQVAAISASTTVSGKTQAYAGNGSVLKAGNVSFLADSTDNAVASQSSVGVSLLGVATLDPKVINGQTVTAYLGVGSNVQASGTLTVSATSTEGASASSNGTQVAAVSVSDVSPKATDQGMTTAHLDGMVQAASLSVTAMATQNVQSNASMLSISIGGSGHGSVEADALGQALASLSGTAQLTVTGNATFQATSDPQATASVSGGGGGIINGSAIQSESKVNDVAKAFADTGATVESVSNLTFNASDTATDSAHAGSGSGGAFADGGATAQADVTPTVAAYLASNVHFKDIVGNLVLQAESVHAQGDADAEVFVGGGGAFGSSKATVNSKPTVAAYIGTGSSLFVGGNVTISAISHADPTGPVLGDTFNPANAVSVANDTINFPGHGLATGDVVTYNSNGSTPLGTPGGPLRSGSSGTFDAIVVSPDVLMLGDTFSGASANTGDLFNPQAGVDPTRDVIRFGTPDNFQTGDAVKYDADGNSPISSSINQASTYYVRTIDAFTIQLFPTKAEAVAPDKTFNPSAPGAVSGSTITIPGHGFTSGEAVTYDAPAPAAFSSGGVDVDVGSNHEISGNDAGANNIYLGSNNGSNVIVGHNLVTGERVTYEVQPGKAPIGGLTNGGTYWVIKTSDYTVQLASSYANALGGHAITLTPDKSNAGEGVQHYLVPAPIGGLVAGQTYYVRNATATTFQLSATPGGSIITLNVGSPADRMGVNGFHQAGIQFNGTSGGTQDLHIDFSTAPAGNDELLGPGGVSLRTITPPPGNGISASSAEGGAGGVVASSSPSAQTNVSATVNAYDAARSLYVGGNLSITTDSTSNTSSHGDTAGGGLVSGNSVSAGTNIQGTSSASVGAPSGSTFNGSGVQVVVVGLFRLAADSSVTGANVSTNSDGGGLLSSADAHSNASLGETTQAVVGTNASVTAQSVDILADLTSAQGNLRSRAIAGGLFGSATADTNGSWNPTVRAEVAAGGTATSLTGTEGVDIRAISPNITVNQDPDGTFYGIGSGNSDKHVAIKPDTEVDGGAGATITAGPRILPGPGVPAPYVTPLQQPSGYPLLALYVDASGSSGPRLVDWDSNVVLLSGPSPDLMIDSSGQIVRAINVSVNGGQRSGQVSGDIVVDPIDNNDRGQALFQSNSSGGTTIKTGLASGPLFTFRETFQTVSIENLSRSNLVLGDINVINTTALEPGNQVTLDANNVGGFQFSVNHDFKPTTINVYDEDEIQDSSSDVLITGTINNPIGFTNLYNYDGSIYAPGEEIFIREASGSVSTADYPTGVIITDSFWIQANSDVGVFYQYLPLDVVESSDGPEAQGTGYRTIYAGGTIYLGITSVYRLGSPGNVPSDGYLADIDRISAGGSVEMEVYTPLVQTTLTPVGYEVQVDETSAVSSPDSPNPMDVVDHFRPNTAGSTPTVYPMGVFGTTVNTEVPIGLVFGSSSDTSTGIIAGGSISIYAGADAAGWMYGYYHVGANGTFNVYGFYDEMSAR